MNNQREQVNFEYDGQDLEALGDMVNYQNWILKHFDRHIKGDVLEIGAGIGSFSELILAKCSSLTAIEPDITQHNKLEKQLNNYANVSTFNGLSDEYFSKKPEKEKFDTIIMINVLEHIENDEETLSNLHQALKPGGKILIFVPALMCLYSEFDKLVGHFRRYTKSELKSKTQQALFEIEHIRYFDFAGIVPWWIFNTKMGKTDIDPKMAKIYDRFIVPVSCILESIISPPIGKNVLMIANKGGL